MNNITKKSVFDLSVLGFKILAYSSGGDLLVQSFIAKYHKRKVHGWFCEKLGIYEFETI